MPTPSRRLEILEHATRRATQYGLEGLSIGQLSKALSMSKSGLISHFESKEGLQLEVLDHAAERFEMEAVRPSIKQPRGEPRLRALFNNWLKWFIENPFGWGCLFASAASEVDDREGPVRDKVLEHQKDLADVIAQVTRTGISEGHFRSDTDPEQIAYDLTGVMLAYHHSSRLLRDPKAQQRAHTAFERILAFIRI